MDRNYGSLAGMNKGVSMPARRSTFTAGYIIGDPFFLTTVSIGLVPPTSPRFVAALLMGVDWLDYRLCSIDCFECDE